MTSFISNLKSTLLRCLGPGLLTASFLLLTGCQATGSMDNQPYNRPLSASDFFSDGRSARLLVPGTVPQTDQPVNDPTLTGKNAAGDYLSALPVPVTADLVKRGQERYGIYCLVCHGLDGHGDGKAVVFGFTKPPDLLSNDIKGTADGDIFNSITNGKDKMFSYGYRVKAPDRWAIIAYLRAMQINSGHLTQDLTPGQLQQIGTK